MIAYERLYKFISDDTLPNLTGDIVLIDDLSVERVEASTFDYLFPIDSKNDVLLLG